MSELERAFEIKLSPDWNNEKSEWCSLITTLACLEFCHCLQGAQSR